MSPDPLAQAEDIRNGVERTTDMLGKEYHAESWPLNF